MSLVRRNVLANVIGRIWIVPMNLLFIPLYIHFLGMEAYGLIGLNATLLAVFALLDFGIATTINREIAQWSAQDNEAQEARNLVRTLELFCWASALLIGLITFFLSPVIAFQWVNAKQLAPETVLNAVRMIGLSIALQWPTAFYVGGLSGLQRHVTMNVVRGITMTLRAGGAVLALWWIAPTIEVFFGWYSFGNAVMTLALGMALWRSLPRTEHPARFDPAIFRRVWRFAAGMSGVSIASLILMQMDKVVLSRLLPLDKFGYYMLAATAASGLMQMVAPFTSALFPRFVQMISANDELALSRLYHRSCQAAAVVVAPLSILIAVFSWQALYLWTHNVATTDNTYLPLTLLVIGFGLNALLTIPYMLQLAAGWAALAFWQNVVSIALLLPLLFWLVHRFGMIGAAVIWLLLNVAYFVLTVPIMHTRLLRGEQWRWYREDVMLPILAASAVIFPGWLLLRGQTHMVVLFIGLGGLWLLATLAAVAIMPQMRRTLWQMIARTS